MNKLMLILAMVFCTNARAELLTATTDPEYSNPASITFYDNKSVEGKDVAVVSSFVGGAWQSQKIYVTIGGLEEASQTFTLWVVGEVLKVEVVKTESGRLNVWVTTDKGDLNHELGYYEDGFTRFSLVVEKDADTDTGYSNEGELTVTYFAEVK